MGLIRASHLLLLMHWTAGRHGRGGAGRAADDRARARGRRPDARDPDPSGAGHVLDVRPHARGRGGGPLRPPAGGGRRRPEGRRAHPRVARAPGGDARELRGGAAALPEEPGDARGVRLEPLRGADVDRLRHRRAAWPAIRSPPRTSCVGTSRRSTRWASATTSRPRRRTWRSRCCSRASTTRPTDTSRSARRRPPPDDLTSQFLWRQFRARLLSIHDKHDEAIALALRAVELTDETEETESQGNSRLDLAHVYWRAGMTEAGRGVVPRGAGTVPAQRHRGAGRGRPATPRRAQLVTTTLPHIPEQCPFVSVEWNMHRNLNVPARRNVRCSTSPVDRVLVEAPVRAVGADRVRSADPAPLDDVAGRDAHRRRRPVGHDRRAPSSSRGPAWRDPAATAAVAATTVTIRNAVRTSDVRRTRRMDMPELPLRLVECVRVLRESRVRGLRSARHAVTRTLPHIPVHVVPISVE